ncbi:hypothetical protein BJX61DRAFT_496969 [Aspergillus egyptiacus]|nr:hypothetical protein BJX61DRAFT_496969 [Aspergillus egyptiacus]
MAVQVILLKVMLTDGSSQGLAELEAGMSKDVWLAAFAPIKLIAAGGFLAVTYLSCRDSTGDIDYLIQPEFVGDAEIQGAFHEAFLPVAPRLKYNNEWMNEAVSTFVRNETREELFRLAEDQDCLDKAVAFSGDGS